MTSMAATVITPPLLNPPNSADGSTTPVIPAAASPVVSARPAVPEAIATSVSTTMAAAQQIDGWFLPGSVQVEGSRNRGGVTDLGSQQQRGAF